MWKCPKCGQKNRIDVCSKCGHEKAKESTGSISSVNFILMGIISIAIVVLVFFCIDAYIDYNRKMQSEKTTEQIIEELYPEENESLVVDEIIDTTEIITE